MRRPGDSERARRLTIELVLMALLANGLAACAAPPPYRQPPDYTQRFEEIETITLVPPKIAVYTMSAGNVEEEVQEWSDTARTHVAAAVRNEVEELGRVFVPYAGEESPLPRFRVESRSLASDESPELSRAHESWLLFEAVNLAVMRHTYDPFHAFQDRIRQFDYTLGPDGAALLDGTEADAFLLIIATDHIPTRDRQALIAAGLATALMTGGYGGPGATPAALTLALIESSSGDLLWYNKLSLPLSDLRDEGTDATLVDWVMKGLAQ